MQRFKISSAKKYLSIVAMLLVMVYISYSAAPSAQNKEWVLPSETAWAEVNSIRHTHVEKGVKVQNTLTTSGYEKKLENKRLEVWFNNDTASIRVVDKASGYIWGTLPEDDTDDMNERWEMMANSVITVEYYDSQRNQNNLSLSAPAVKANYNWRDNSLLCDMESDEIGLSLSFSMELQNDSLVFSVKRESIKETGEYKIKSLYFVPFLGCTREDSIDGYIFVPDGPGALIRFNKPLQYVKPYEGRIYGLDYGVDTAVQSGDLKTTRTNDYITDEEQASIPVYGIVHGAGQNAMMGIVEEGAEYGTILAYPSGVVTPYNWAGVRFDYRCLYNEPISQDGSGIEKIQEKANDVSPKLRLIFLTGDKADYSGMAVTYRNKLLEEGRLKKERLDLQIPLHLNIVGADVKKDLIFKRLEVLTTSNQAKQIVETLNKDGINNITVTFEGWKRGGINGSKISNASFEKRLGNQKSFESLRDKIVENGGRFYLIINSVTANKDQISLLSGPAITMSGKYQTIKRMNNKILYNEYYFLKPPFTISVLNKHVKKLSGFDLAFKDLGMRLNSDYTRNYTVTRTQAIKMFSDYFSQLNNVSIALNRPNVYLWDKIEDYLELPITTSQYTFETDTVPFLSIVLKGHVDYYAPYVNQGFYSELSILKMIEFGAYPSFIVSAARSQALYKTPLEDYFSINFNDWHGTIQQVYARVNEALAAVEGSQIERHTVLSTGIVKVVYSNGSQIIINYTAEPYRIERQEVPPMGFAIVKGD